MKNSCLVLILVFMYSCKQEEKKEEAETTSTSTPITETKTPKTKSTSPVDEEKTYSHTNVIVENVMVPFEPRFFKETSDHRELLGFYVGWFKAIKYDENKEPSYSNKINISINHIKKDSIFGHSVVAGNARPFQGIIDTLSFKAKVAEPGDDKYDGVFEFKLYHDGSGLDGIWVANNPQLAVPERSYELIKRKFIYNPTLNLDKDIGYEGDLLSISDSQANKRNAMEYVSSEQIHKINASTQKLTAKDVENLDRGELEVIRNLIYARHGYSFKNRRMRYFFDSKIDWYIPISTDVRTQLTDLEKKNIDLIKRYEQHAEKYYDYFGR